MSMDTSSMNDISQDLEIKHLKDRLDFNISQLRERELQIQHYKQLVKTLEDLLHHQMDNNPSTSSASNSQDSQRQSKGNQSSNSKPNKLPRKNQN